MSWNGMCNVMPTISEDGTDRVLGVLGGENEEGGRSVVQDSKIEQLMVNMLDQRLVKQIGTTND
jgi:hypothetical protein